MVQYMKGKRKRLLNHGLTATFTSVVREKRTRPLSNGITAPFGSIYKNKEEEAVNP